MRKLIDKKEIIKELKLAAQLYKENLVGRKFLFIFNNQYIEVLFSTRDFLHLTGVNTCLTPDDFYKKALNGLLQVTQISFTPRHPYRLAQKKLKHLKNLSNLMMGECIMLQDVNTNTRLYKFGVTDLEFSVCFVAKSSTKEYFAKSLRDEDCFTKCYYAFVVTHIYAKDNDKTKYEQEVYQENGYTVDDLSEEVKEMLSNNLL